jgi:uncharacterized membrane protein YphA (DoxX/SURF4 family)
LTHKEKVYEKPNREYPSHPIAFLIGRLIVGVFYLYYAAEQFLHLGFWSGYAAFKGVPAPQLAVIVAGILLAIGGLSLLTGYRPRVGVAAIVLFFLPVTFIMHNFWAMQDLQRTIELASFMKNMGLMGSSLMFLSIPQPWAFGLANTPDFRALKERSA